MSTKNCKLIYSVNGERIITQLSAQSKCGLINYLKRFLDNYEISENTKWSIVEKGKKL